MFVDFSYARIKSWPLHERWQAFCSASCRQLWHRSQAVDDPAWRESIERRLAVLEAAIAAEGRR